MDKHILPIYSCLSYTIWKSAKDLKEEVELPRLIKAPSYIELVVVLSNGIDKGEVEEKISDGKENHKKGVRLYKLTEDGHRKRVELSYQQEKPAYRDDFGQLVPG